MEHLRFDGKCLPRRGMACAGGVPSPGRTSGGTEALAGEPLTERCAATQAQCVDRTHIWFRDRERQRAEGEKRVAKPPAPEG